MRVQTITSALGSLALIASASLLAGSTGAAAATPQDTEGVAPVAFSGGAYGSQVKIAGPLANSGKTAFVTLGCTQRVPLTHRNSTLAVDIDGIGRIGAVESRAKTRSADAGSAVRATTSAEIADSSLLSGLIEVGAVTAKATTRKDADGYHASTDFSIASLSIAGTPVEVTGEAQVIPIAGVGTLALGQSDVSELGSSASASVNAIVLTLDGGTVVRIGHAQSATASAVNAVFGGGAYGTTVKVAGTVTSGRTAWQPMPCVGTRGNTRTNDIAGADLGALGTTGAITSSVFAKQLPLPTATATNEIVDADLGLLHLEGIAATVTVDEDANGDVTYSTEGTELGSITLAGLDIPVPAPGESVKLLGVGTLHFLDVTELRDGRGAEVVAVRLVLLDNTEVVLARAAAVIK